MSQSTRQPLMRRHPPTQMASVREAGWGDTKFASNQTDLTQSRWILDR